MQQPLESLLKRDRMVLTVCLCASTLIATYFIVTGAGLGMSAVKMTHPDSSMDMDMVMPVDWSPAYFLAMFVMWWVMMIAMMLPSAAPVILLSAALNRRSRAEVQPYGSALVFTLGYLLAWAVFSVAAVCMQWWLEQKGVLSMRMQSTSTALTGSLLILAGAWQLSPMKHACLRHCRSPIDFLTRNRRPGTSGALLMGIHHGLYCLGCCWFLMALLFVGGVMNLYWIVGLALFVWMEKVLMVGAQLGRPVGILLVLWGAWELWQLI